MDLKSKQFMKENFTIEEVVHRIKNLYRKLYQASLP